MDAQYFIDKDVYNCPFCKRGHVMYHVSHRVQFDWADTKTCWLFVAVCASCNKRSMHLAYDLGTSEYRVHDGHVWITRFRFDSEEIDQSIFHSVPTSFFTLDERIPAVIRELIVEADGCRKMNFLTGASACARKAIYEFLIHQSAEGEHYEDKIKSLKLRHADVDPELFDTLYHIQDMTSDKVHEQSWPKWNSKSLGLIIETLKAVLHELYVVPAEKAERALKVQRLREEVRAPRDQ